MNYPRNIGSIRIGPFMILKMVMIVYAIAISIVCFVPMNVEKLAV